MERIGLAPGTEIGGYRVLGPVGRGGMGAVYRARDADGRDVALKLLHPHLVDGPARERLEREVAALQRVRHPGVARVLDAEIDSAEAFVVTELVDGPDLATHVAETGPLPVADLAELAERLRAALAAVHEAGVLHRDLTPANVLIGDDGPVIIDFGIAQAAEDARVTTAGQVAGTPGYLSPEVLGGAEPSRAADWWGWAATLAFAATGRAPFGVRPLAAVLARVRTGEVDLDEVAEPVAGVLRSALAVRPADRPEPAEVVERLVAVAETGTDPGATEVLVVPGATAVLAVPGATEVLAVPGGAAVPAPPATAVRAEVPPTRVLDVPDPGEDGAPLDGADADAHWDADPETWDEDLPGEEEPLDGPVDEGSTADDAPARRTGSVLALGVLLAAVGASRPGVALVVAVLLAVLARSVGLDVEALHTRRARRGPRRGETARAVVGWPWYLVRAALGVTPAALVAASVVLVVGGVGWWAIGTGRWQVAPLEPGQVAGALPGAPDWVARVLLVAAVAVGLVMVWFGPMSRTTRVGARYALAALAPGRAGAATLVLVALAAAGAVAFLLGQEVVWWPLPGAPDLR